MHVTYALDNMLLAKILLLKLRDIDVSGDSDLRIAAVHDEDFSSSFVPKGGLHLKAETEAVYRRPSGVRVKHGCSGCERNGSGNVSGPGSTASSGFEASRRVSVRKREETQHKQREAERQAKEREHECRCKAEASQAAWSSQLRIASGQPWQLVCYGPHVGMAIQVIHGQTTGALFRHEHSRVFARRPVHRHQSR